MIKKSKRPKIVVIGGGTGTYTVLSGLKNYDLDLSVIVSMMDDGGSNRIIRDQFGLLPTSDIRQCIVALSSEKPAEIIRELFNYRYTKGSGISGMTFGNLFMAAVTDIYGSQQKAIEKTCEFLDVQGKIIPVTYDDSHLVATYDNGEQLIGQGRIASDPPKHLYKEKIKSLELTPKARANPQAIEAIKNAHYIILGPGDLYSSILCNFVVDGIAKAVATSKAKVVIVMNLMTKRGESYAFKSSDFIHAYQSLLPKGKISHVVINKNTNYDKKALDWYRRHGSTVVKDDLVDTKFNVFRADVVSSVVYVKPKSDVVPRSIIRHDSVKLARSIAKLI